MSNIFFPDKLSPQGFLTDMILAQIRSNTKPFNDLNKIIYGYDFSKKTQNKLFFLHPDDKAKLLKEDIAKATKTGGGFAGWASRYKDEYIMRRYVNFLNNMTTAQQAALVPYIRLYAKVFKGKKFLRTREIVFNKDYKIPNSNPVGLYDNSGTGNAGITSLAVNRDFQYYGIANRFTVEMNFFFDSFETFANGMQKDTLLGAGIDAIANRDPEGLLGQDQGSGYISLIKKGSKRDRDGEPLREYLILEYGYRFPNDISQEIVSNEDRIIFESQEKKELRIGCYKHDFKFSETGEVNLAVSYYGVPDIAMASRDEEKTNDVFLISNKGVIEEIMDEPSEAKIKQMAILKKLKDEINELKKQNDLKKKLLQNYCRTEEDDRRISKIDEEVKEINKLLVSKKKTLLGYVEYFFLRYFMTYDSLFTLSFTPVPLEAEAGVLTGNTVVDQRPNQTQTTRVFLNPVTVKKAPTYNTNVSVDYKKKIKELVDLGFFVSSNDDGTLAKTSTLRSSEIEQRFGEAKNIFVQGGQDKTHLSYSFYQALQTFTLSRLTAQTAAVRSKIKEGESDLGQFDATLIQELETQNVTAYTEKYGNITFFPLKALISAALDFTLDDQEDEKNFPIICIGNALADSLGKEYYTNIGDLLIDVDFFKEWIRKKFIDMEKMDPTLEDFMNAIFESLVPSVLGAGLGHFSKGNHGPITRQVFDLSEDALKDPNLFSDLTSSDAKKRERASLKLAKFIKKPAKKSEVKQPLIVYYQESNNNPTDIKQAKSTFLKNFGKRNFNKKEDYNAGIYHVLVGQNTGVVKGINFSYMNDPYLNTLFSMKNPNHLAAYLRYSYEANVDFVGNDLFFGKTSYFAIPKNQFNVNQTGLSLDKPDKDVFGLSGYYQISKTTDRISMGEYTTTVTAKNMYSPNLEEAKTRKCNKKSSIDERDRTTTRRLDREKEIKSFVTHDIAEYIRSAFKSVPGLRERFNINYDKEREEQTQNAVGGLVLDAATNPLGLPEVPTITSAPPPESEEG